MPVFPNDDLAKHRDTAMFDLTKQTITSTASKFALGIAATAAIAAMTAPTSGEAYSFPQ